MTWLKRFGILLTWLFVIVGGGLALMSSQDLAKNRPIRDVQIEIYYPDNQVFIVESDFASMLREFGAPWDSTLRSEINISLLEEKLRNHPLILGAEVFSTWDGVLHIQLQQKKAQARIIQDTGMMYVDVQGGFFPLSKHSSLALPVLSGISDSSECKEALDLLNLASLHRAFPKGWAAMDRNERGSYTVYPQWHAHRIYWGQADHFEEKAHKVNALYAELLQSGSLDSLKWVDARFNGQVVYGFNK